MRKAVKVFKLILTLLLACILFNVPASVASESLDESQQLFFNQFRYAVQAHETSQLLRLTHPSSLACVPEEDWDFYYGKILDGLVRILGKRQSVRSVTLTKFAPGEVDISKNLPSGENVSWPVMPEAQIIMQYEQQGQEAVASLYLAKDNNIWKWIHICTK